MLLARKGYRVLVVDRATFPSDTVSTHVIHAPGVAALQPLGAARRGHRHGLPADRDLLVRLRAVHDHRARRAPATASPPAYAPRRTVLDKILVDAAARGRRRGARALHRRGGRRRGRRGRRHPRPRRGRAVGRRAGPGRDRRRRTQLARRQGRSSRSSTTRSRCCSGATTRTGAACRSTASRSSSVPIAAGRRSPTNDGLTMLVVGWPLRRVDGVQGRRRGQLPQDPRARARSSPSGSAARRARSGSTGGAVPNFFRKPYGPGWALVGDAGYNKDPITAQGISDAFRDAELCADALDEAFTGGRSFDDAHGRATSAPATRRCCRSTSSPRSWPRSRRRPPRCSSCSVPCTATKTRWTPSSASPPAPCRRSSSSIPQNIGRIMGAAAAMR